MSSRIIAIFDGINKTDEGISCGYMVPTDDNQQETDKWIKIATGYISKHIQIPDLYVDDTTSRV